MAAPELEYTRADGVDFDACEDLEGAPLACTSAAAAAAWLPFTDELVRKPAYRTMPDRGPVFRFAAACAREGHASDRRRELVLHGFHNPPSVEAWLAREEAIACARPEDAWVITRTAWLRARGASLTALLRLAEASVPGRDAPAQQVDHADAVYAECGWTPWWHAWTPDAPEEHWERFHYIASRHCGDEEKYAAEVRAGRWKLVMPPLTRFLMMGSPTPQNAARGVRRPALPVK